MKGSKDSPGGTAPYSSIELMICAAARALEDNRTVVVGTGAPCAAAMLAQKLFAPNLIVMFEAGGVAPLLLAMPISVGDSRTVHRGIKATSMAEIMATCQRGLVDFAFLGGAQIDRFGNLNSTMIGEDYRKPRVRLPGSGGANDLGSFCWRTIIIIPQDARKFVPKLDFITTPGYLTGRGAREEAGLPAGTGPYKVITNLAVIGFDEETKCMKVESLHPTVSREQVEENTGFELLWSRQLVETEPPSPQELATLRTEVDPRGYITGRR